MQRSARTPLHALLGALVLAAACACDDDRIETTFTSDPEGDGLTLARPLDAGDPGAPLDDLVFRPLGGEPTRLSTWAAGAPFVVAVRDRDCPVSRKYVRILAAIEDAWTPRGVKFLFVNPAPSGDAAGAAEDRERGGYDGPYVHDADRALVRRLGAATTTEVFVFDAQRRPVYRGAVDDRFGVSNARPEARNDWLERALEAVTDGRRPEVARTSAPGCVLELDDPVAMADAPTFHADVSPLLQRYCQSCHRPQENAPFDLVTYDDVHRRKGMIRYVLEQGIMPPWQADPHVGGPWLDDLRMPEADRKVVLDWIASGAAEGDPAAAPAPVAARSRWRIDEPDLVLQADEIAVPAEGMYQYHYAVVETGLDEDRFVSQIELRSSHLDAVHHMVAFEWRPEMAEWDAYQRGVLALQGYFAIYFPGSDPARFPPGVGRRLAKGSKLLLQIHYNGNGSEIVDRPEVGIVFSETPPERLLRCDAASTTEIQIPPGARDVTYSAAYTFDRPARLFGFMPHMHTRGRSFLMELLLPDGERRPLLRIDPWDFEWQQAFRLRDPIEAPAGSRIVCTATYDNSADNPANPAPDKWVSFGLGTDDEMLVGYFEWLPLDD